MSKHGCVQMLLKGRDMNTTMAGLGLSLQLHTITWNIEHTLQTSVYWDINNRIVYVALSNYVDTPLSISLTVFILT